MAFNILRKTVEKKVLQLKSDIMPELQLSMQDAVAVISEMYHSKTARIIKQVPRSHIILLVLLEEIFKDKGINMIEQDLLFKEYNTEAASMMI